MNKKIVFSGLATGLLMFSGASASASSLLGDSIDVTLAGGIVLEDFGVIVGDDVELLGGDASTAWGGFLFVGESIDIGADTISMAFDLPLGDGGMLTFSDLDFGAGIGGVTLTSTIPAVQQANVSFTSDSITLDLSAWFAEGGGGTLDLQLQAVPVPAAVWLFGSALLGFGGLRRRKA
ncbi:MAG: VPLPA-CTERM sorting domain-containing protein [Gammaproteobacteria bacterium]